ncbi:MAG: SgcJ/EcaC family oxidoreductase [Bryobacterales bacterium]|nr:SgcJ/EcaC family oxidoreductase [Bryobacterales bacterium]
MRIVAALLLIMSASLAALAQTGGGDAAAIRSLVAKYAEAREQADAAAIQRLFTAGADQLVSNGEWRRGRESLVKGMLASSRGNPGARTITVESIRLLSTDVAIADARYEIDASDGREARRMWSTFLAVRGEDGWRIAAIRNMAPAK